MTSSTKTKSYTVSSLKPSVPTTTGQDRAVTADEILVDFVHDLTFKIGFTYELNTQLVIFSSAEEGKIVRLQDRPKERMLDNGLVNVSVVSLSRVWKSEIKLEMELGLGLHHHGCLVQKTIFLHRCHSLAISTISMMTIQLTPPSR